jgi:hypothetical protein
MQMQMLKERRNARTYHGLGDDIGSFGADAGTPIAFDEALHRGKGERKAGERGFLEQGSFGRRRRRRKRKL